MNGEVYWAMLNDGLLPLEKTVFVDEDEWCFYQDSAPIHKVKKTQKCPTFHRRGWLAFLSPDLNQLDYKLCVVLEERTCTENHQNLNSLKATILKAAREFPWPWFVNRSMTSPRICGTACRQKEVILNNNCWNIFFEVFFKVSWKFCMIFFVFASKLIFEIQTELMALLEKVIIMIFHKFHGLLIQRWFMPFFTCMLVCYFKVGL